jgi:hypothetical protein
MDLVDDSIRLGYAALHNYVFARAKNTWESCAYALAFMREAP